MVDFNRKTAVKIKIDDLKKGTFMKSEGDFDPSYVIVSDQDIGRVNLMGIVIEVTDLKDSLSIDDGTGIIVIRSFSNDIDLDYEIGSLVNIIGKPREFNDEIFVSCEIIKPLKNPLWAELRKKEIYIQEKAPKKAKETISIKDNKTEPIIEEINMSEEEIEDSKEIIKSEKLDAIKEEDSKSCEEVIDSPVNQIICLVRTLDNGDGADFDKVINDSGFDDAEKIINNLLEEGELFEVKSGKLKVLE